jgi:hypothetical protein
MLREYIQRHKDWSLQTFGEGKKTDGLIAHITKELDEIKNNPTDVMEWIDVIILAMDGAWRAGYTPLQIVNALNEKQAINFGRKWSPIVEGQPTEHVREE